MKTYKMNMDMAMKAAAEKAPFEASNPSFQFEDDIEYGCPYNTAPPEYCRRIASITQTRAEIAGELMGIDKDVIKTYSGGPGGLRNRINNMTIAENDGTTRWCEWRELLKRWADVCKADDFEGLRKLHQDLLAFQQRLANGNINDVVLQRECYLVIGGIAGFLRLM